MLVTIAFLPAVSYFVLLAHTKNFCYAPGLKKAEMASTTSKDLVSFLFRQKFNSFWSIYGSCSGFHTKSEALSYKCTHQSTELCANLGQKEPVEILTPTFHST